jgi:hypothetical protein
MSPTLVTVFLVWRIWVDPLRVGTQHTPHRASDMVATALLFQTSAECHAAKVGEAYAAGATEYREPECRPEALEVKP